MFYYTPFIILPLLSVLITGGLAIFSWRRRTVPLAVSVFWLMAVLTVWGIAYSGNTAALRLDQKIFFHNIGTTCACLSGPMTLFLAIRSAGRDHWLTRRNTTVLLTIPVLSAVLIWTNSWHQLHVSWFYLIPGEQLRVIGFRPGPFYAVHYAYALAVHAVALLLWGREVLSGDREARPKFLLLFVGTLLPLGVEISGLTPTPGFRLLTSSFWVTGVCYVWAIFRHRLFDLLPLARTDLFDHLADPVMIFDLDGRLVDSNAAAKAMFDVLPDTSGATLQTRVSALLPAIRDISAGSGSFPAHDFMTGAGEKRRHWHVSYHPITRSGQYLGLMVEADDVTHLKTVENELLELNRLLEKRIETEIARRIEQERLLGLQSKMAAMGEMLGAISHQWRQPLSTLGMILQRWHFVGLKQALTKDELDELKNSAMEQIVHMSDTIDEFRAFYLPEKNRVLFPVESCVLNAVRLLQSQFTSGNITISVYNSPEPLPLVNGYVNEFKQVILNLLINARDAIVTARAQDRTDPGDIRIMLRRLDGNIVLDIEDNGCGVPEEFAAKVFSPYFTTKANAGGTGIGLYISRLIIEQSFGGAITFSSRAGRTLFAITIPAGDKYA